MKILITGAKGQLGHDAAHEAAARRYDVIASGRGQPNQGMAEKNLSFEQLDITDEEAVFQLIREIRPDAIIHCAAWTAVDAAEIEENWPKVRAVNVDGTRFIAEAARETGSKVIYISTDYVFDGEGTQPWKPDEQKTHPLNVYGATKLEGEAAVQTILDKYYIVRTSWTFGSNGKNFVKTMIGLAGSHETVRVVNDQIGTPTYTFDLARLLVDMTETDKFGIYHATNEGGYISWYDFCMEIYRQCGLKTKVIPMATSEYGLSKASRPHNSRLDKSKLAENGFSLLPDWRDALMRYLSEIRGCENGKNPNRTGY